MYHAVQRTPLLTVARFFLPYFHNPCFSLYFHTIWKEIHRHQKERYPPQHTAHLPMTTIRRSGRECSQKVLMQRLSNLKRRYTLMNAWRSMTFTALLHMQRCSANRKSFPSQKRTKSYAD